MLPIHINTAVDNEGSLLEQLNHAAPTLWRLANLCAEAVAGTIAEEKSTQISLAELPLECQAILFLARQRGSFDVKIDKNAFDSSDRILTVHVEIDENIWQPCRAAKDIRTNVRYVEAFFLMCRLGLVIHHVSSEFTLSTSGFTLADEVNLENVKAQLDKLVSIDS